MAVPVRRRALWNSSRHRHRGPGAALDKNVLPMKRTCTGVLRAGRGHTGSKVSRWVYFHAFIMWAE